MGRRDGAATRERAQVRPHAAGRSLKAGLTADTARDIFWVVARPDICEALVGRRGWTPERYEGWIAEAIAALLLH